MRLAFWIILLELVTVFTVKMVQPKMLVNDSVEYLNLAENLVKEHKYYSGSRSETVDYRLFSKRTAGYPVFLQLHWLKPALIYTTQGLLVLFSYLLGLLLIRKIVDKKMLSILYTVAFSTLLALFCHAGLVLSDLMLTVVVTAIALIFYSGNIGKKWKSISLLWLIGVLIKPVLLPTIALVPVIILFQISKKRFSALWLSFVGVAIVATVFVNYSNTKQLEYSSISTINLSQYNAKLAIAKAYGYDSAQQFSASVFHKKPETVDEYDAYKNRANSLGISAITENWESYLLVHSAGALKMLLDPGRFELFTFAGLNTSNQSLTEVLFSGEWRVLLDYLNQYPFLFSIYVLFFFFRVVLVSGLVFALPNVKKHWFLWAGMLYFLAVTGPVGAARFFLPANVCFVVLSTFGWSSVLTFFQKSSES